MADSVGMAGGDGGASPDAGPGWLWDVALSFAGAQRDYVGQVAAALKARGVRRFYDADEQVRLWGTHLSEELPRIYARESAAVVVFVSADYAAGDWTRLERRAALVRAVAEAGIYVLPARFDRGCARFITGEPGRAPGNGDGGTDPAAPMPSMASALPQSVRCMLADGVPRRVVGSDRGGPGPQGAHYPRSRRPACRGGLSGPGPGRACRH